MRLLVEDLQILAQSVALPVIAVVEGISALQRHKVMRRLHGAHHLPKASRLFQTQILE